MILYRTDTRLLCAMKRAQGTLNGYVLLTDIDVRYCPGYYIADVNRALEAPQRVSRLKGSPAEVHAALKRLTELGCLAHPTSAPVYQVTYDGWNARAVRRHEVCKAIVTHVVFPSLVALVTTLLTLSLKSCSDDLPDVYPQNRPAEPAYYDNADFSYLSDHN